MADDKMEKKLEKARKKEEKRQKKMAEKVEGDLADLGMEEDSLGGKFAVAFVTLVIVVIWLAILVLLIKWDVGGFGSTVMTPLLKNVPYVNRILPESALNELETETEYPYQTLEEAADYIKTLEIELQQAQQGTIDHNAYVEQLQKEIERLQVYEANEAEFEAEKEKFYNEVVFSEEAPDIDTYIQYYESIDPANAEAIYKRALEQSAASEEVEEYVATYSKMKPKQAAAIFDTMTDDLNLVAEILQRMTTQARADILGNMSEDTAAKVTEILNPIE